MENIALEVFDFTGSGSQFARLLPDTSITFIETSEVFDKGDIWSLSFKLNVKANPHLFGSAGEIHGSRLHYQLDRRRSRIWVMGTPFHLGYLRLSDESDVDDEGNVDVSFESGLKTFENMIEGMNARDVPLLGNHLIGVALWRERKPKLIVDYKLITSKVSYEPHVEHVTVTGADGTLATRWPKLVVHQGSFTRANGNTYTIAHSETINTDSPYDDNAPSSHPYCNVDIGYQKHNTDGEAERGYTIHKASYKLHSGTDAYGAWPNTAPCFYVMYWFRALMEKLGIYIEENQMQDVQDLRRLFMMNTLCAYDEPDAEPTANGTGKNMRLTGITLSRETPTYDIGESGGVITDLTVTRLNASSTQPGEKEDYRIIVNGVAREEEETLVGHPAYATSDCFPDVDASSIIAALEDGFGVRLLFSDDYNRVRVVMLRNIFRSKDVQEVKCDVVSGTKTENNVRGFMMTYGVSDNTAFSLPLFDRMLSKKHETTNKTKDYTLVSSDYATAVRESHGINKRLYYTESGNAYAVKIDEQGKRFREYFPSLHEMAGFMDAVDGDCTGEKGTFEQKQLGFTPLIVNDARIRRSRSDDEEQSFFVFIDEEMKASSYGVVEGASTDINADIACGKIEITEQNTNESIDVEADLYVFEKNVLHLLDNYEQNDDGIAPIESHNWGLTLGVMRGSGSDAWVKYSPDPDDHEENDTWETMPGGNATAHSDTCDDYGRIWDYNGSGYASVTTAAQAVSELQSLFTNRTAVFYTSSKGYIDEARIVPIPDDTMTYHDVLIAISYSISGLVTSQSNLSRYLYAHFYGHSVEDFKAHDSGGAGMHIILDIDSNASRRSTLLDLCQKAYGSYDADILIDNGIGSRYGRFSLKLRAEKPNPDFDATQPEGAGNPRYLSIEDPNLRGRGLMDQFYKEYSYIVQNGRIARKKALMDLSTLRSIDKAKKAHVGDTIGFIKKMQYTVSMEKGLGPILMDILYI